MKRIALKKLGDKALFQFNRRTRVIWQIQSKKKGIASITATVSGITKNVSLDSLVWCKD